VVLAARAELMPAAELLPATAAPRRERLTVLIKLRRHVRQQVVGYAALMVALGGVSYAAVTLPKNSVGSAQLRNGQVKRADIGKNAVTAAKVKNGSLLAADFKAGQLVAGAPGPKGVAGAGTAAASNTNDATFSFPAGGRLRVLPERVPRGARARTDPRGRQRPGQHQPHQRDRRLRPSPRGDDRHRLR
jgi:hypothetical protein